MAPIENYGLREAALGAVGDDITVYLHTGNPGSNGTSNRVASSSIGSATITATSGWTIHATQGHAELSGDLDFGNANAAVAGISWTSMFKGSNFFARRELAAPMDAANGAPVTITGSSVVIEFTSTD